MAENRPVDKRQWAQTGMETLGTAQLCKARMDSTWHSRAQHRTAQRFLSTQDAALHNTANPDTRLVAKKSTSSISNSRCEICGGHYNTFSRCFETRLRARLNYPA